MTVELVGPSNVDPRQAISEPAAHRLTDRPPAQVIRFTWLMAAGGILASALAPVAALLAGTIVGIPAALRALNAPAAAWLETTSGTGDELVRHHLR